MGKKKDKKDKLPKTIAGVKVPKELRGGSSQIAKLAKDPVVREIALAALAAGLAARKDARRAAKCAAMEAGDAAEGAGKATGWVTAALGAAAVEAGRMVLEAIEDSAGTRKASSNGTGRKNGGASADAEAGGPGH